MNLEIIRERVSEFRPFTLVTSSGNKYAVPHQDFIFFTVRTVVVATQSGGVVVLDPLHIVSLENVPRKNEKHKRRRDAR